jgi:hypothetical protein
MKRDIEAMAAENGSRTRGFIVEIRRGLVSQEVVPHEASSGWPIPSTRNGVVYLTIPYFRTAAADGRVEVYPPFSTITARWDNGRVVSYRDLRYEGMVRATDEPVGVFPHPAVASLRRSEYMSRRDELFGLYDELLVALGDGGEGLGEKRTEAFCELLAELMEPGLVPFYRHLSPAFAALYDRAAD